MADIEKRFIKSNASGVSQNTPALLSCADANGKLEMDIMEDIRNFTNAASAKGKMGEYLIRRFLESKNFVVYMTKTDASHCFDLLAVKNKLDCFFIECKTKSKRERYNDTGIDYRHYMEYKRISDAANYPLIILFVDAELGEVYGNYITKLEKPYTDSNGNVYPLKKDGIIYFPLRNMKRNIAKLDPGTVKAMNRLSRRRYAAAYGDVLQATQRCSM